MERQISYEEVIGLGAKKLRFQFSSSGSGTLGGVARLEIDELQDGALKGAGKIEMLPHTALRFALMMVRVLKSELK